VLVLKTYKRNDPSDQRSHQNEVRSYQILMQHEDIRPNIVELHGHFQHGDNLNLILEYIDGGTLEKLYKSDPPSAAQMLDFWTNFSKLFIPVFRMHELKDKYRHRIYRA
jgi:serine/threonine protein kinase